MNTCKYSPLNQNQLPLKDTAVPTDALASVSVRNSFI